MLDTLNTYGTFWFYAGVAFCGALFVALFVPETSNLNSAQIEKLFEKNGGLTSGESSNTSSDYEEGEEDEKPSSKTPLIQDLRTKSESSSYGTSSNV